MLHADLDLFLKYLHHFALQQNFIPLFWQSYPRQTKLLWLKHENDMAWPMVLLWLIYGVFHRCHRSLMISFCWLLLWDFQVFCTAQYISHSIHYGNGMVQLHTYTPKTHPCWNAATYFAPSHSIPTSSEHTVANVGLLWVTKHHSIPLSFKHTAAYMGLLWVTKHHTRSK